MTVILLSTATLASISLGRYVEAGVIPQYSFVILFCSDLTLQVGTRLYDGPKLGIVYQVDASGKRNSTMPTLNDKDKDPEWIFNAERRIIYTPRVKGDAVVATAPRMKVTGQTSISLLVNALGDPYPVDSTNECFRVHTLDTTFTPKAGIDPSNPPPEIFTDFLIFESTPVMVANMSVNLPPQSLRLIEVPVIDLDQEGATVVLFSSNRTIFDVFHPVYIPCAQIPSPIEPFRCFIDCFNTRQCPRDCDVWQFAYDNSYHTAPLGCSSSDRCRVELESFRLNMTSDAATGQEPFADLLTDAPPVPARFLPMLRPEMYSTRTVPHVGVRMCLTKGPRIRDGELIRNTTAGLFSFVVESYPAPARSSYWSTVNLRTFSPSVGFFDSIINVTVSSSNVAPTFSNASVTNVPQNTPTPLSLSVLTQAADADGDLLQFHVVDMPMYGKLFQYPSDRSEFDLGSAALARQYAADRVPSLLNDRLTSLGIDISEILQHPLRKTFPRAPLAHANVTFVKAYANNVGFQNLGGNTTDDFVQNVCGTLGVYPVEFEYEKAVFVSKVYMVGLSFARRSIKYRVLMKSDPSNDALPHVAYDLGHRHIRAQAGNPPDIQSGSTSFSESWRKRAFNISMFRDKLRPQRWTELYRGTVTQSSAFTSDMWAPPIAPSRERTRILRVEFCGANNAGPGKSDGRDFSMESGVTVLLAGGLNDRSTGTSVVLDAGHRIVYVPDDEFRGDDRFTVIVSDFVLMQMMVATVPLRVQAINDPPIATKLEIFIKASDTAPTVITLQGFDVDASEASLSAFIVEGPEHGSLLQFSGEPISKGGARVPVTDSLRRVSFTSGGKAGTPLSSFRYLINDGFLDSRTVTVSIHSLCGVGQRLQQSTRSCVPCAPGYVMPDIVHRHAVCIACKPGYYQDKPGSGVCAPCAKGYDAPDFASSACKPCNAGYFAADVATPKCPPCPLGEFQPRTGASSCLLCGSLAYTNTVGSRTCIDCPPFSRSNTPRGLDSSVCMCIRGYFDPIGRSGFACSECPYGAFCAGQQFPPVPYAGFYTDRRLWSPAAQLSLNSGADDLDIALQYFASPSQPQGNASSVLSLPVTQLPQLRQVAAGNTSLNTSLAPSQPVTNVTIRPPSTSAPAVDNRRSLDESIAGLRPVFFACGLYSNPSACSGYPDTDPFLAVKMCRHRPVAGKCSSIGEVQFNYTSTSLCAPSCVSRNAPCF
jgi:hypothetical protein